jgi:hypothetical protein
MNFVWLSSEETVVGIDDFIYYIWYHVWSPSNKIRQDRRKETGETEDFIL